MEHHGNTSGTGTLYTCPMHPEIVQDKPGNCPKCGMNLVPVNAKEKEQSRPSSTSTEPKKEDTSSTVKHVAPVMEMQKTHKGFKEIPVLCTHK